MSAKKGLIAAAGIAAGAAALSAAAARFTYEITFHSPQKGRKSPYDLPGTDQYVPLHESMIGLIKEMESIPFLPVEIFSSIDNTRLFARYYHVRDGAPLLIQCHGYRSNALRDFCGGNKLARENGYNTLVIDERAHGNSGGDVICFGVKEKLDIRDWAYYAAERLAFGADIFLCGVSMGAAAVLMASELELPENVRGVIADCPYCDQVEIIKKVCAEDGYPAEASMPFIKLGARLYGGFSIAGRNALQAVANTKLPILIIHGEDDRFVPVEMSRRLDSACASEHELHTFPGAGHALCYMIDPERYGEIVTAFIKKHSKGACE